MTCEEFAEAGFDFDRRDAKLSEAQRAAAEAHVQACSTCAAQRESWRELREQLQELARETQAAQTPERVELQLRRKVMLLGYERGRKRSRTAITAVALAAAALVVMAVGVRQWERYSGGAKVLPSGPPVNAVKGAGYQESANGRRLSTEGAVNGVQEAALAQDEFVPLPGSLPIPGDEETIVQMRMQRGALSALGLAVNEEQSDEWIVVDLLVSVDGQPQAVRLARTGGT